MQSLKNNFKNFMTLINLERAFCEDELDVVYFSRAYKNSLSRVIVQLIE